MRSLFPPWGGLRMAGNQRSVKLQLLQGPEIHLRHPRDSGFQSETSEEIGEGVG